MTRLLTLEAPPTQWRSLYQNTQRGWRYSVRLTSHGPLMSTQVASLKLSGINLSRMPERSVSMPSRYCHIFFYMLFMYSVLTFKIYHLQSDKRFWMMLLLYYFLKCICNLWLHAKSFCCHVFQRKTGERLVLNFLWNAIFMQFSKTLRFPQYPC